MTPDARRAAAWLLLLLAPLQGGCLAESALDEVDLQCGPRDLTVECCLKKNPGQWERCTGNARPSAAARGAAGATAVLVALQPVINSAERRGVELATDLRSDLEAAILKCVREAERAVNDHYFNGESPSRERCAERKREGQTWAMYLGQRKHDEAQPCLARELKNLIPRRYLLQARFRLNERTGQWEYLDKEMEDQIVSNLGWMALEGSIAPDIVIIDGNGVIIRVYDMKFPCPGTNDARWDTYKTGRWTGRTQGELYAEALRTQPMLVSPQRVAGMQEE